jgi:hypothetical protein
MVNAALAWKAQTGQKVNVVIGAMAASMGAAFTVQTADRVSVHRNSLMMFHGAWGLQIGGSEAMKDYGGVLEKINANTKAVLLSRYNLQPETVAEWFREGREGWLTADEMKAAGIAQEVVGADDAALDLTGADLADFDAHGLKVAALAQGLAALNLGKAVQGDGGTNAAQSGAGGTPDGAAGEDGHGEAIGGEGGGEGGAGGGKGAGADQDGQQVPALRAGDGGQGGSAPASEGHGAGDGGAGTGGGSEPAEPCAERVAGREEGRQEAVAEYQERVAALQKRVDAAEATARRMQGERDQARAELEKARKEHAESLKEASERLKVATDRLSRHLDGGLSFSPAPTTWEEAMRLCGGVYEKAAAAYPELRRAFNEQNKRR